LTYVADWALFNDFRWAAQLLFSRRREMAFVMPVRAKTGHGELNKNPTARRLQPRGPFSILALV
jgi:hypothetical protein